MVSGLEIDSEFKDPISQVFFLHTPLRTAASFFALYRHFSVNTGINKYHPEVLSRFYLGSTIEFWRWDRMYIVIIFFHKIHVTFTCLAMHHVIPFSLYIEASHSNSWMVSSRTKNSNYNGNGTSQYPHPLKLRYGCFWGIYFLSCFLTCIHTH